MYQQLVFVFVASCFVLHVAATCTQNCLSQVSCPTFWTAYRNHCYRFFNERVSWLEANKNCGVFGAPNGLGAAHLVTLHSAQEQEVVLHIVRESSSEPINDFYIGFTDAAQEGKFKWVDGQPANFLSWHPSQPDNRGGNENCGGIGSRFGNWHDLNCETARRSYVCKMPRF